MQASCYEHNMHRTQHLLRKDDRMALKDRIKVQGCQHCLQSDGAVHDLAI